MHPITPSEAAVTDRRTREGINAILAIMWLLILEALAALAVFVLIVWWTMFAGRRKGERDSTRH